MRKPGSASAHEQSKIYVDDRISDAQMEALEQLLPFAFSGFSRGMRSVQRAGLSIERTEEEVRFSGRDPAHARAGR